MTMVLTSVLLVTGCSTVRVLERRDGLTYGETDARRGGGLVSFSLRVGPGAERHNSEERERTYAEAAKACGGAFEISREHLGQEGGGVSAVAVPVGEVAVVSGASSAVPVRYLEFRCRPDERPASPVRPVRVVPSCGASCG
jgi:hypothetical protein